jgi:hypothetical protein
VGQVGRRAGPRVEVGGVEGVAYDYGQLRFAEPASDPEPGQAKTVGHAGHVAPEHLGGALISAAETGDIRFATFLRPLAATASRSVREGAYT